MDLTINPITGKLDIYSSNADELISIAAVINAITNETNWDETGFNDPGGILAQIKAGQYYFHSTTKIRYEYDGTTLHRFATNNI